MQPNYISVGQVFGVPGRLTVPLFQRPYVWTKEEQWLPLWQDIADLLERIRTSSGNKKISSHFLGTVVLEQKPNPIGTLPRREIIDGQQRLTTLQVLLKSAEHELNVRTVSCDSEHLQQLQMAARQIAMLCENEAQLIDDDRFKIWPTNEDRAAFKAVMEFDGSSLQLPNTGQLGNAYTFFREKFREHLNNPQGELADRAKGIAAGLRDYIKLIVLDLDAGDEPQAIFETLNAHGTPLLPSDLMKNWLLWEASKQNIGPGPLYERHWREFDRNHAYWRLRVGVGHAARARVDTFLQNWISKETLEQVSVKHLYDRFLHHVSRLRDEATDGILDVGKVMETIRFNASLYQRIDNPSGTSRFETFLRRLKTLDVVVFQPVLLELLGRFRDERGQDTDDLEPVAVALESYLVRRMVCGYQTRGYGSLAINLLKAIKNEPIDSNVVTVVRAMLRGSPGSADWWPDDSFFKSSWCDRRFYGMLRRERVVMLLQAIEQSYMADAKYSEPFLNFDFSKLQIEHILPQKWTEQYWPLIEGFVSSDRDALLHGIGNLTLLSGVLNPALSNAPWESPRGISKRKGLAEHSKLELNFRLQKEEVWDETKIKSRAITLFETAQKLWPPCPAAAAN